MFEIVHLVKAKCKAIYIKVFLKDNSNTIVVMDNGF